jgi:hypothetical protein
LDLNLVVVSGIVNKNGNTGLTSDGGSSTDVGANKRVVQTRQLMLITPPGATFLEVAMVRTVPTNPATFDASLTGYAIPPGSMGRIG